MSISGIANNIYNPPQVGASSYQQQIQQLSQDLQSGNLTAAQSDFQTLQQAFSQPSTATTSASTTSSTSNPLAQAFSQLGSDLQSGNLSAAKKDLSTFQQDLQTRSPLSINHFNHRLHLNTGGSSDSSGQSALQDLSQIGQSLTANNLSGAQQAYSTLEQQFQQFALGGGSTSQATTLQDQPPLSLVA